MSLPLTVLLLVQPLYSGAVETLIWHAYQQRFIPIVKKDNLIIEDTQVNEKFNFHLDVIKLANFEEKSLIIFKNNDSEISGITGELWNVLSEYLNFTLVPLKVTERNFGNLNENGSFNGLLGLVQKNEAQVIPRIPMLSDFSSELEFTIPLWKIRYNLYIKPLHEHYEQDQYWILKLFTTELWVALQVFFLALCFAGYLYEKNAQNLYRDQTHIDVKDNAIYTVAIVTQQGEIPGEFFQKSRVICVIASFFSWIIFSAFNSLSIYLMTNESFQPPFNDLKGLIENSQYDLVTWEGIAAESLLQAEFLRNCRNPKDEKRISFIPFEELYARTCLSKSKKFCIFNLDDLHRIKSQDSCNLVRLPTSYFERWISSGVKRNFHRESFDFGILRTFETGILSRLKNQWLPIKQQDNNPTIFRPIGVTQIALILMFLLIGLVASVTLFVIESIVSMYWEHT
ncbi:hypothetical protein QAD02_017796 [Eretmocerus hayati]|uniref:Uncharacterized protein n=1 Tax=Eretmocerus hayati TaxID=131215 RepID=A0ACC2PFD1_9HYME|nr:hypothetical protein QAD02_017796 [Eretmocerus hayati]